MHWLSVKPTPNIICYTVLPATGLSRGLETQVRVGTEMYSNERKVFLQETLSRTFSTVFYNKENSLHAEKTNENFFCQLQRRPKQEVAQSSKRVGGAGFDFAPSAFKEDFQHFLSKHQCSQYCPLRNC